MRQKKNWSKILSFVLIVTMAMQLVSLPIGVRAEDELQTETLAVTETVDETTTTTTVDGTTVQSSSDAEMVLGSEAEELTPLTSGSSEVSESEEVSTSESKALLTSASDEAVLSDSEETSVPATWTTVPATEASEPSATVASTARRQREQIEFEFVAVEGGYKITKWNRPSETTTEVTLPNMYEGQPVIEIDKNVFQRYGLTKVVIPENIKIIGESAFADNQIATIEFSKSTSDAVPALTEIGPHAFADNELTSVELPARVTTIGAVAFGNNKLTTLTMGESVMTIGNSAFRKNNLTAVTLPNSITSFGENVFGDNGRYVKVTTDSTAVPKLDKSDKFGHVIDPITITILSVNKDTGDELLSPLTLGDDLTQKDIFVVGEEVSYTPQTLEGFYIDPSVTFTPDRAGYVLTLEYIPTTTLPEIEIVKPAMIEPNTPAEEVDELLRSFVKATDLTGADITSEITYEGTVDSGTPGSYDVTYRVTDQYGNTAEKLVPVLVGTDWNQYEIGDGWTLGDFTYDGSTLTGFSAQGREKLNTNKM